LKREVLNLSKRYSKGKRGLPDTTVARKNKKNGPGEKRKEKLEKKGQWGFLTSRDVSHKGLDNG